MLPRFYLLSLFVVVLFACFTGELCAVEMPADPRTVWGIVMEQQSGTPDVAVCLCDAQTGMPLMRETYEPMQWDKLNGEKDASDRIAMVISDDQGYFRFEHVPEGRYRLIAQRWMGPFKGVFARHGTVIQLMGIANDVLVPRPKGYYEALIGLRPPGKRIVVLDPKLSGNETYMFLSTAKPTFDTAAGLHAMGLSFFRSMVGFDHMTHGRTTIIGAPDDSFYIFLCVADNWSGFLTLKVEPSESKCVGVPYQPFVAGWSDGHKTPPADLAELMRLLDETGIKLKPLYGPENFNNKSFTQQALLLETPVDLPEAIKSKLTWERPVRLGDLMAIEQYKNLQWVEKKRQEQKKTQ